MKETQGSRGKEEEGGGERFNISISNPLVKITQKILRKKGVMWIKE
jgi:hypothetical protein